MTSKPAEGGTWRQVAIVAAGAVLIVGVGVAYAVGSHTSKAQRPAATTSRATTRDSAVAVPSSTTSPQLPLTGITVGIDPGHNGGNFAAPGAMSQIIWNGRADESCDTTGTETDGGYTEAQFNFNVAQYLTADLEAEGATVVATRTTNSGVGPCVDQRAQILNRSGAEVSIDIHADGGPADGRGFTVLEPVSDGPNDSVISSSEKFGADLISAFTATGMPISDYDGVDGVAYRSDLAGLNLTTMPKVLIETGNMRNPDDAALLTSDSFQRSAAQAMARAITHFLEARGTDSQQPVHGISRGT